MADWIESLDRLVPNGIRGVLGPEVTCESLARLIAAFIYMATVEHEILGTGLWNYQMWTHVQPVRMYENGQREPLDVYQRLVNANFNLNVHRAQLMQDWSYLALDAAGFSPRLIGRSGASLAGGEDSELCRALLGAGWVLWYEPRLRLRHFMPAGRLTLAYARRLSFEMGRAAVRLEGAHPLPARRPPRARDA